VSNEEFLRNWLYQVWVEQDFSATAGVFDPAADTPDALLAGQFRMTASDYETMVMAMCLNFEPRDVVLTNVLQVDDDISAQVSILGVRRDTAAPVTMRVHIYRKIRDRKFVTSVATVDYLAFFRDVGQLPPDSMEMLMMGVSYRD